MDYVGVRADSLRLVRGVSNGDEVVVTGKQEQGLVRARTIHNVTINADVLRTNPASYFFLVLFILVGLGCLVIFGMVAMALFERGFR
ncbi:MAG: hypothetical protein EHM61_04805 [Acidobacteria bacterium]|nr:MAG: hypothetical protein EHM61_04805 [Acidobacteriota bacterium]